MPAFRTTQNLGDSARLVSSAAAVVVGTSLGFVWYWLRPLPEIFHREGTVPRRIREGGLRGVVLMAVEGYDVGFRFRHLVVEDDFPRDAFRHPGAFR